MFFLSLFLKKAFANFKKIMLTIHWKKEFMKLLKTIVFLCLAVHLQAQSNSFDKIFITPVVSVGYTFGASFNFGIDLDLTTSVTNDPNKLRNAGISLSHYYILMQGGSHPHSVSTIQAMFENERMDLKSGYAFLGYKWGLRKVNGGSTGAFSLDVAFTNRANRLPWLGIKSLVYNQREWAWFDQPYFSPYLKQKFYLTGGN